MVMRTWVEGALRFEAVNVNTILEEMRIQVEVADTGMGIPPENLDKIFTDFFTTRKDGTGLGLSNVRRLAADCGARISVANERANSSCSISTGLTIRASHNRRIPEPVSCLNLLPTLSLHQS